MMLLIHIRLAMLFLYYKVRASRFLLLSPPEKCFVQNNRSASHKYRFSPNHHNKENREMPMSTCSPLGIHPTHSLLTIRSDKPQSQYCSRYNRPKVVRLSHRQRITAQRGCCEDKLETNIGAIEAVRLVHLWHVFRICEGDVDAVVQGGAMDGCLDDLDRCVVADIYTRICR